MDRFSVLTRAREYLRTLRHVSTGDRRQDEREEDRVWRLRCRMHAAIHRLMSAETEAEISRCREYIIKTIKDRTDGSNQG